MIRLPAAAIHRLLQQDRIPNNKTNYAQIAPIPQSKVNKIILTNDKIKQFNNFVLQLNSGSITMKEAVLQIRGSDRLTDLVLLKMS